MRQIAELGRRVEALEQERESLTQTASLLEQQVQELQQHVQLLMEKNQAKQQVICMLSEKVTQDFLHPPNRPPEPSDAADRDFLSQQEKIEHLKDDMEAYRTQNHFLNSEIHQVTKIWRRVAEKERALLMKVKAGALFWPPPFLPLFQSPHHLTSVSLSPRYLSALPLTVSFMSCLPSIRVLC